VSGNTRPITWSHSRLSLFHQCPFAWRCRYLDHKPEAPSEAFYNGRRFHEAVSEYALHCLNARRSTDYEVGRAIANRYADVPDVREMMEAFVESWAFDVEHMVGLEQSLIADLPNGDRFQGVLDYLSIDGEHARITDWKTWHSWPEYDELRVPLQLLRYAWLVKAVYPQVETVTVAMLFVRFNIMHEWLVWDASCDEIVEAAEWVKREVRSRRKRRFEATPGGWCSLCGFTSICPVASAIVPEKDMKKIAEKLTVLDGERGRLRALLLEWAKANGPVEVAGGSWEYVPAEKPSLTVTDMEGLLAFLPTKGVDWLTAMTFPANTLNKWYKEFGDEIAPFIAEKQGKPVLRFRKSDADHPSRGNGGVSG
jgi:hypothetical protein